MLGVPLPIAPGDYITPPDWNNFISQEDVVVLDSRNLYETKIGKFTNARMLDMSNFRQFPALIESALPKDRQTPIAMYCTGGIRC